MLRRRKIQARPNVASASLSHRVAAAETDVKSPTNQASNAMAPILDANIASPADGSASPGVEVDQQQGATTNAVYAENGPQQCGHRQHCPSPASSQIPSPQQPTREDGLMRQQREEMLAREKQQSSSSSWAHHHRTPILLPPLLQSPQPMEEVRADTPHFEEEQEDDEQQQNQSQTKRRREPPKDKLCDTKKFKMADLVNWRPKTDNTLRKKWAEKRKMLKNLDSDQQGENVVGDNNGNGGGPMPGSSKEPPTAAGPRVKINEHGELVLDEDSLVLVKNPEMNAFETINDDFVPKKLTSMSFKNVKRAAVWGVLETDLFYEVLAATGTDFGLMHEFIPTRSRIELKQKFNREERLNPRRMDETLRNPVLLDERLRHRVEMRLEEMAKR